MLLFISVRTSIIPSILLPSTNNFKMAAFKKNHLLPKIFHLKIDDPLKETVDKLEQIPMYH